MKLRHNLYCIVFILFSMPSLAIDHVRFEKGQSLLDMRNNYKLEVLRLALEHTSSKYGGYKITTNAPVMNATRARKEIQEGESINVFIAVSTPDWERDAIPIKIPVRKGLLNYRLILIHQHDLPLFEKVTTITDLKELTVGLLIGWSLTKVMEQQGFKIKTGNNYDSIFEMLDSHRFNFLPRGVNEVFGELAIRKDMLNNVIIEPKIALHIPSPSYIFVSPKYPKLAQRLEEGFEIIIKNGEFDKLFHQHFDEHIKKANLSERRILNVENGYAPDDIPWQREELWFIP